MMRKIWVVKLADSFFCIDIRTGHPSTTANPRKAMRWFDWAPAEQMARRCGQGWAAVAVETFDSPNVIDLSKPTLPKIPPKPNQPQLPIDDAFRNIRTSTT